MVVVSCCDRQGVEDQGQCSASPRRGIAIARHAAPVRKRIDQSSEGATLRQTPSILQEQGFNGIFDKSGKVQSIQLNSLA